MLKSPNYWEFSLSSSRLVYRVSCVVRQRRKGEVRRCPSSLCLHQSVGEWVEKIVHCIQAGNAVSW